jgi:hypothetical protein
MDPQGAFVRGFDANTPAERIVDVLRGVMAQSRQKDHPAIEAGTEKLVFAVNTAESRGETDWNRPENIVLFFSSLLTELNSERGFDP